ncbi:MAG: hypothetical protein ACJ79K_16555 [Gemmatimonadaceae bacterium]
MKQKSLLCTGALALAIGGSRICLAQMPATPVLQNAWANAGITIAADYGKARDASAFAGAVAWSPRQSRFQLSAGAGVVRVDSGGSQAGYGGRLSIPLVSFASGNLGTAIFGGVGVTSSNGKTLSTFPIGVALGFRHALGATRGISAYVAPFYEITRNKGDSLLDATGGAVRASVGVDLTVAPQIGVTVGYEMGADAKENKPGPRGGVFGVGISYALHRQ